MNKSLVLIIAALAVAFYSVPSSAGDTEIYRIMTCSEIFRWVFVSRASLSVALLAICTVAGGVGYTMLTEMLIRDDAVSSGSANHSP
jgi:hypothetical protein